MTLRQALRPKEPKNLGIALGAGAVFFLVYAAGKAVGPWSPKRGFGLAFGILATALFIFEMLYPLRRPRARPLGTAKAWAQAHVYLGALAFLAVLLHGGLAWPHGGMGFGLLLLSAWTTVSGLAGVSLQKWIPSALADGLRVEALYERIPSLVAGLAKEADRIVGTAEGDVIPRFYKSEVRGRLTSLAPGWSYLFNVRAGRERALAPFRRVAAFVEGVDRESIEDLQQIYEEKLELDAQYRLQGILRAWLVLHAPPAGLLMGLVLVHILSWALY